MSERLAQTLRTVALVAAEDTRHSKILLDRLGISKPIVSLQKFNERKRIPQILAALQSGSDVALVSDAGTPGVSDPGARLVEAASGEGFVVSPIPGPSALTALASVAGIVADGFYFGGFFPRKSKQANDLLKSMDCPMYFFESPKRIGKSLAWLTEAYPDKKIVAAKELTKKFEKILRGTVKDVNAEVAKVSQKGEWCFVLYD